jgi:hypothetical protein
MKQMASVISIGLKGVADYAEVMTLPKIHVLMSNQTAVILITASQGYN